MVMCVASERASERARVCVFHMQSVSVSTFILEIHVQLWRTMRDDSDWQNNNKKKQREKTILHHMLHPYDLIAQRKKNIYIENPLNLNVSDSREKETSTKDTSKKKTTSHGS